MFWNRNWRQHRWAVAVLCAVVTGLGGLLLVQAREAAQGDAKTPLKLEPKVNVSEHVKRIQEFVKNQEIAAKKEKWNYTTPSEEELSRKLTRVHSPMIVFQGWSGNTSPGGSISYNVGIYNPDPIAQASLYAHVFIGPANMTPDVGAALQTFDPRFPRLTMPAFFGLTLKPGGSETLHFTVAVPSSVEKSNYLGNTFLFRAEYHDVGQYLDRSVFPFEVK